MPETQNTFSERCAQGRCRSCGKGGLLPVLDLGQMPLTAAFLTGEQLQHTEEKFPLEVVYCPHCSLVQVLETVPAQKIFCEDYPYYSSFSDALLKHSRDNVLELIQQRHLTCESFVVELASNDGYLLRNYVEKGIGCLGIDPAEGPAREAEKINVPTLCDFFTPELARKLAGQGKRADIVHANNVLAHVEDLNGFVEGIGIILKDTGVAVIEVPYVCELIAHNEFDTIYHEHLCYYSVTALDHLFRRHGLFLNDVRQLPIHGGSLRLFVEPRENPQEGVRRLLEEEHAAGVDSYAYYQDFARKVENFREKMYGMLSELKKTGKDIAAYGAAAKGAILLNYINAGTDFINYVVDRNVHKQGKYMPGVHIPVYAPSRLLEDRPDYVIILPWNFKDEIIDQQQTYHDQGGKFIIPIPEPVIV